VDGQPDEVHATRAASTAGLQAAVQPRVNSGEILGHISNEGDVLGGLGGWLGTPGSGRRLEAIMLPAPVAGAPPEAAPGLDCQMIFGPVVMTEWTPPNALCGSRGLGLGCAGLRFRLQPAFTPFFICRYDIAFTDGSQRLDLPGMAPVLAPKGAFVEAIRLNIRRRSPGAPLLPLGPPAEPPFNWSELSAGDPHIACRVVSPAFEIQPPVLRHGERIPPGSRQSMAVSWERGLFPASPVSLRVMRNVVVASEGIVFDSGLELVQGTGRLFSEAAIGSARDASAQALEDGSILTIPGFSVLCKSRAADNYGHFLIEMLPRAWLARQMIHGFDLSYIVHQSDLLPVVRDALRGVGVSDRLIRSTDGAPIRCETLVLVDGMSHHGIFQSPLCALALSDLAAPVPRGPFEKIFVRRRANTRSLLNEDAVEALLRARGFVAVEPGRMTVLEQAALFKGARIVVGALGAAMTNIAFCEEGAKIVALTSASFPDTFFWFLSRHRRHDYMEIRGVDRLAEFGGAEPWVGGFTLAEDDLAFLATL
jgi:capsular polysaccharide biosynthesis protein